ncbi:cytidine deaminase [Roseivirga sp. E12]|uniref:cytidine deaminase n=1 Tax=Roseivirga sp. E12 TaxID=2819237 RepID=UPI001ABC71CE|nr:cytidine deaminase [Roseivirga sp. E12]MBO3697844.1 cytidine deaminase [Roseivirga sp. E12]
MAKELKREVSLLIYKESELDTTTLDLINRARSAAQNARAPYSDFQVGAALMLSDGSIVLGNNQENAAYPAGLCAERVAFFAAKANKPEASVLKVAIAAVRMDANENNIPAPCGSCRQVMSEYENDQASPIEVYLTGGSGDIMKSNSIENLLPFKFSSDQLGD